MSALADEPDDLLRWCEGRGHAGRPARLPAQAAVRRIPERSPRALRQRPAGSGILRARVENIVEPPFHGGVRLQPGRRAPSSAADAAVLAAGHASRRAAARRARARRPWTRAGSVGARARSAGSCGAAKRVVLVGTGLTAVDVAMSLTASASPGCEHLCRLAPRSASPGPSAPGRRGRPARLRRGPVPGRRSAAARGRGRRGARAATPTAGGEVNRRAEAAVESSCGSGLSLEDRQTLRVRSAVVVGRPPAPARPARGGVA